MNGCCSCCTYSNLMSVPRALTRYQQYRTDQSARLVGCHKHIRCDRPVRSCLSRSAAILKRLNGLWTAESEIIESHFQQHQHTQQRVSHPPCRIGLAVSRTKRLHACFRPDAVSHGERLSRVMTDLLCSEREYLNETWPYQNYAAEQENNMRSDEKRQHNT